MPCTVFKCLWDYIQKGEEIFAFVKNKAKDMVVFTGFFKCKRFI